MIKFEDFLERILGRKLYVHELEMIRLMTEDPDKFKRQNRGHMKPVYKGLKAAKVFYDESIDWINGGDSK